MDSINILLTGFKLLPIIQGIVCGGLFAAGLLLSWMLRSNLHGEMETEKEFARQHKISYYQIDQGHKILFFWSIFDTYGSPDVSHMYLITIKEQSFWYRKDSLCNISDI